MGKGGKKGKEERRAKKAAANKERSRKSVRRGAALDRSQVVSFSASLKAAGLLLYEVSRDGNCFFRSLADQLEQNQHLHHEYRHRVLEYMESREDEFAPFLSFGEGDEEEDKDYDDYLRRMRREGEWAGQPELLAAAQALRVDIVVHQYDAPNYRIEARRDVVEIGPRLARERRGHAQCGAEEYLSEVHVSYHDGEHYNSVRPLAGGNGATPSRGRGREGAAEGDEAAEHVSALTLGEAGETRGEGDCEGGGGEEGDGVGGGAAGEDADECAGGVGSGRKKGKRDKKAEKQARAMARRQAAALAAGGARTDEDGADEDQAGPVSGRDQTITL